MSDIEKVNMFIALYGAVVATAGFVIALILGVNEYKRNQPLIRVRLDTVQILNPNPRIRNNSVKPFLSINVSNHGTRPVTIVSYSFIDKRKHIFVLPEHIEPPFKLEDGESHDISIPIQPLADKKLLGSLRKIRVRDATGKKWETNFSSHHKRWILESAKSE